MGTGMQSAPRGRMSQPAHPERRSHRRAGFAERLQDLVYGIIRWAGGHVRGFYSALGVYLLIGFAIVVGALGLFALLVEVVFGGFVQRADEAAVVWMRGFESDFLDGLAVLGVALGSGIAAWVVIGIGSVLLWRSRHHFSVVLLWVALGGARFLNEVLKEWFDRPRPAFAENELDILGYGFSFPSSPSFPSGHALTSTVIFFTIAYLVARLEPTRRMRRATILGAAAVVLLVSLSRVYLGVHYPSDVLAGVLAGILWATFAALGIEVIRYFWSRKPEVVEAEADLGKGVEPLRDALPG